MSNKVDIQAKQQEVDNKLWSMANELRGNMDASEFKNYILGLIFYKFLSDKIVKTINDELKDDNLVFETAWADESMRGDIKKLLINVIGYFVEPQYLFGSFVKKVNKKQFSVEDLKEGINALVKSTTESVADGRDETEEETKSRLARESAFSDLFEDMDLDDNKLGKGEGERSELIGKIINKINDLNLDVSEESFDILGHAYEFLIGEFAANAGKKAGEFYTPAQVSELIARIVTAETNDIRTVYDPTCGSGSLLLKVKNKAANPGALKIYGQEKVSTTYNLARMNMLLHSVDYEKFDLFNDDTLNNPAERHQSLKFDAIVANPPYSAKWDPEGREEDERFNFYDGAYAPKKPADYAFVQHMLYHLDDSGTLAVVLPHGTLFRKKEEDVIRKKIVKDFNWIDAVISLPANLFYGTPIPTCIVVFKKCRKHSDNILFINATKEFVQGKKKNYMTDENIDNILKCYLKRETVPHYSYVASMEEVAKHGYLLNVLAYVKLDQKNDRVDSSKTLKKIEDLNNELTQLDTRLRGYLSELGIKELNSKTIKDVLSGKIRFPGEFAPWERITLSDVLVERKQKNPGGLRVCSVAVKESVVDQIQHLGRSYAASNTSNYNLVKFGDVVYTKSPTGSFPYGIIKQSQLKEDVVISPLYGVFIPTDYSLGYFLHCYFSYPANANNYLAPIIQKGAKNTINITNETFLSNSIVIPTDSNEQEKISSLLRDFDRKVEIYDLLSKYWEELKSEVFFSYQDSNSEDL